MRGARRLVGPGDRLELLALLELAARGAWGLPEAQELCRLQFWLLLSELYLLEPGARAVELAEKAIREVEALDEGRRRNGT